MERSKILETCIAKVYDYYDAAQSNNTVLISKLTMMAQAGGFGGPNTVYRKELEALKAPALTDLEEYEE